MKQNILQKTELKKLGNLGVSVFCENMAMMLAAGIVQDEAAGLLCEDADKEGVLYAAANAVQQALLTGSTLADAVEQSGAFPTYVGKMLRAGEMAGRTEQVLRTLAGYYAGRDRLDKKLRSAVLYPMVLLLLMTAILVFLVAKLLPVFTGVYRSVAGELTGSAYGYIGFATAVGWVALAVTILPALALLYGCVMAKSDAGKSKLAALFERMPATAQASGTQALADFTRVLSIFIASGIDTDSAVAAASELVIHSGVKAKLGIIIRQMQDGKAMATAFYDNALYAPLYGRMLVSGARSGQTEQVLGHLAEIYTEEADRSIDALLDSIEPALSFFLTVAVGVTLLATMLPLIGILGAIG